MNKIKIGIHQHVFTSKLNSENLQIFDFIKEIGFDSMDVNLRNTDFDFAGQMRKKAESLNLFLTGGGSLPKTKEIISSGQAKKS